MAFTWQSNHHLHLIHGCVTVTDQLGITSGLGTFGHIDGRFGVMRNVCRSLNSVGELKMCEWWIRIVLVLPVSMSQWTWMGPSPLSPSGSIHCMPDWCDAADVGFAWNSRHVLGILVVVDELSSSGTDCWCTDSSSILTLSPSLTTWFSRYSLIWIFFFFNRWNQSKWDKLQLFQIRI